MKGLVIREVLRFLKEEVGAARFVALLRTMPPEWSGLFDLSAVGLGMLPATWYPMTMVQSFLDGMLTGLDPTDRIEVARRAARAVATATMSGVHKSFFELFGTPELYVRYAPKIWSMYYDRGTYEAELSAPKRVLTSVRGWPGHHIFLCEMSIEVAGITFEKMDLPSVRATRTTCISGGAQACTATIAWGTASRPSRPF